MKHLCKKPVLVAKFQLCLPPGVLAGGKTFCALFNAQGERVSFESMTIICSPV